MVAWKLAPALATSKRIAKIAFTGSTPVGSHILKCAAENIIPLGFF